MRVSNQSLANQLQGNVQQAMRRLAAAQEQISSGKRINRLSDDPFGAARAVDLKSFQASLDQYKKNIDGALPFLNQTDSILGDVDDVLNRAREVAVAMANGALSAQDRANAAAEVHQLLTRLVALGNSKLENRYMFGGFVNGAAPFALAAGVVAYSGDAGQIFIQADASNSVAINLPGDRLLQGVGVAGGVDLFDTLSSLEAALNADNVSGPNGITTQIGRLDRGLSQVLGFRAEIGARLQTLSTASAGLEIMNLRATGTRSKIEDIDAIKVFADFALLQQAFQAALQASARAIQPSILDFLR
jgi:flagellar hook-associated protein 3 FlgL